MLYVRQMAAHVQKLADQEKMEAESAEAKVEMAEEEAKRAEKALKEKEEAEKKKKRVTPVNVKVALARQLVRACSGLACKPCLNKRHRTSLCVGLSCWATRSTSPLMRARMFAHAR